MIVNKRPTWNEYYLGIAESVSKRGECTRRQVGAVIVKDHTIVSTGYNGSPPGRASCLEGHCPRATNPDAEPGTGYSSSGCVAIHAEANAIMRAGRERCVGATIYINTVPCDLCMPLIEAAGIERMIYDKG